MLPAALGFARPGLALAEGLHRLGIQGLSECLDRLQAMDLQDLKQLGADHADAFAGTQGQRLR